MHSYNIHEAKTHLSELIARVELGEDIVIARAGKPVARLTLYGGLPPSRQPGSLKGRIWMSPDFDAADAEIERMFYESELFPPDK